LLGSRQPREKIDGEIRGVAYYRTSKASTQSGIRLKQQKPLVDATFNTHDILTARTPLKDNGISRENFDREGLEVIEDLAKEGEIDAVVVSDIDRLGRIADKTIRFAKHLRKEHDVYIIANVRWYDLSNGDDLETFCAKAGRAESENKKRGGRGNRAKLAKLLEDRSSAYLTWFRRVPFGYKQVGDTKGIEPAGDYREEVCKAIFEVFLEVDERGGEYAETERRVKNRFQHHVDATQELEIKKILTDLCPLHT
jgi:DNA invertase Pin-like site-specific DNA recombinase